LQNVTTFAKKKLNRVSCDYYDSGGSAGFNIVAFDNHQVSLLEGGKFKYVSLTTAIFKLGLPTES
jgi:hypothetical protein